MGKIRYCHSVQCWQVTNSYFCEACDMQIELLAKNCTTCGGSRMEDYSGQGCAFSHCSQCSDTEDWKVQGAIIIYDKKEDGFAGLLPVDESNEDESDESDAHAVDYYGYPILIQ